MSTTSTTDTTEEVRHKRIKAHASDAPLAIRKLAIRHTGIITQRALHWHRCLPQSVRNHYDVEDMVSDVIMHVLAQSPKHDASRGRESTFVWWTADNKCKCILKFWQKQMRAGAPVEVVEDGVAYTRGSCSTVELSDLVARRLPCVDESPDYLRALDAVERVIEYASDAALDVLEDLLSGGLRRAVPDDLVRELRTLAAHHNASMDDFLRVLHATC